MNPFRNILRLFSGDLIAKALNFFVFIYLARILGIHSYGMLEFSFSIMAYAYLLASLGCEIWATRQIAWGYTIEKTAGLVIPLRFFFSSLSFLVLVALLPLFPDFPYLRSVLIYFGFSLFANASSLKWVFLGKERMGKVALGLVVGQFVFACSVFAFVREPEQAPWVAVFWLLGELAASAFYLVAFLRSWPGIYPKFTFSGSGQAIKPILTLGATQGMGLLSYNFDVILMGFLLGTNPVGWYRAAYKPITAALALPMTFFAGLFPAFSRTSQAGESAFRPLAQRALHLSVIFAIPAGITGSFLAAPVILLLFGDTYLAAIPVMQLLSWALAITILRGTYRNGLAATGRQKLDLLCAGLAVLVNILLNILLIPEFGMVGAATATIASEITWLVTSGFYFNSQIFHLPLPPIVIRPVLAGLCMVGTFFLFREVPWVVQLFAAMGVYFGVLLVVRDAEIRSWVLSLQTVLRAPA